MSQKIDIIGIGAINVDYIFSPKKTPNKKDKNTESGIEDLNKSREEVMQIIKSYYYKSIPRSIQIGGSAYLTIKTISSIDSNIKTAFVGVYGEPDDEDKEVGFNFILEDEFRHLHDRSYLFNSHKTLGTAVAVLLKSGNRESIGINPGANLDLAEYIKKQNKDNFINYLSSAKWLHVSSFSDFNQFEDMFDSIREAKLINPILKVSLDPGYEYTKSYKDKLKKIFKLCDLVFLNDTERQNLVGHYDYDLEEEASSLSEYFNFYENKSKLILINKSKKFNRLFCFNAGLVSYRTFWHPVLAIYKIHNDTGAGDAFSGGVLAGMLSDKLLLHQPFPIKLGAVAASARMRGSRHKSFPVSKINEATNKYLKKYEKIERNNYIQRIKLWLEKWLPSILSFLAGIITSIIASLIYTFIEK